MTDLKLATEHLEEVESSQNALTDEVSVQKSIATPEVLIKDYRFIRELGEGTNGKTYLAVSRVSQQKVAVKVLKFVDKFKSLELFEREAATLSHVHVSGVPKFFGYVTGDADKNECYIIQEYFDYPSLQDLIEEKTQTGEVFSEQETLAIMYGMANILVALQMHYSPPIIHRDIKPSNILYDPKSQRVMLIDFGAVANPAKRTEGSTVAGTLGYMSPEQLMGECSIQSDYYALGATALHLMTGIAPVEMGYDVHDPFLLKFEEPLKSRGVSDEMIALIRSLVSPEIEKRPANAEILQSIIRAECRRSKSVAMKSLKRWKRRLWITGILGILWLGFMLLGIMSFVETNQTMLTQAYHLTQSWLLLIIFIYCIVFVFICLFWRFCNKKYRKEFSSAHRSIDLIERCFTRLELESHKKQLQAQPKVVTSKVEDNRYTVYDDISFVKQLTLYRQKAFSNPAYPDYSEYVYKKEGKYYYYLSKLKPDNLHDAESSYLKIGERKIKVVNKSIDDVKE